MKKAKNKKVGQIKADESNIALMCLVSFGFFQNTDTTAGTPGMNQHYWAPLDWFASGGVPDPPATGSTAGATVTAGSGGFSFNTGFGFINMQNDLLKGSELEFKSIGDPAAPGVETMAKGRTLGLSPQLVEQFLNMIGTPGILLVKDTQCAANQYWVVGCDCNPAYMTFDFKAGTKGGNDVKGTNYELKSICPPYSITLTPSALAALMHP